MYPAGQHPIYAYTEDDKLVVLENVGVKEAQIEADAEAIKDWVQKQPHLAEAGIDLHSAAYLLLLTRGSVEKAKQEIDYYYKVKAFVFQIHDRVKLLRDQYRPVWHTHVTTSTPKLYKGSRVTFTKIFDWQKFKVEDALLNIGLLIDIRFVNDFASSDTLVIDLENATLGQIVQLNILALSKAFKTLSEGLSLKISAIHIVNCDLSTIIQTILNFCKTFLSKKLLDRIKFHEASEDLHEFLPKEYLPEDYGGYLPSLQEYRDKMENLVQDEKTKQFLIDACNLVSDESKRPKTTYSEDHLPGNFKKLEID